VRVIYKYAVPFVLNRPFGVRMPQGARVLSCQVQRETLTFWAMVDPEAPMSLETVRIFGTGTPFDDDLADAIKHVATVQHDIYVWHVFIGG
jgi:hypothetical protein